MRSDDQIWIIALEKAGGKGSVGQEVITSLREAIAWAGGEDVPVRLTKGRGPCDRCTRPAEEVEAEPIGVCR